MLTSKRYLYKSISTFIVLFFLKLSIYAQITYTAVVLDARTKESLPYATVKYNDKYTTTDLNGKFTIHSSINEIELEISYTGYTTYKSIIQKSNDENSKDVIFLKPDFNMLDKITVTSSRYRKPIEEATVSITSLKNSFLEKNQTVNFENILEKIPGVNFVDGQVNIRGGSGFTYGAGSRVMVLINNMPALQFDSALPNWDNIPSESIRRIEVVKGAGSALYGSAAMNGVINILPVQATEKLKIKAKIFHRIYDSPEDINKKWWKTPPFQSGTSLLVSKRVGKLGIVGSAFYQGMEDYKKDCFNYYGRATLQLDYHLSDKVNFGIHANYNNGKKLTFFFWRDMNEGAYQADEIAYSGSDRQMLFVDPHITYYTSKSWKHKFQGRIYLVSNLIAKNTYDVSKSYYGEYQIQKKFEKIKLAVTGGLVASQSYTQAKLYADTIFSARNNAIYIQLEKKLFDKLNVNAGIRNEYYLIKGPKLLQGKDISDNYKPVTKNVFRFGANYKLFASTHIRASWGQGFRYPTIAEKFTLAEEGDLKVIPNPDLKPEKGFTGEIGIRQNLRYNKLAAYLDISAFQSEYDDMIELELRYNKGFYFTSVNLGNTVIKGIELESGLSGKISIFDINMTGGYLYLDPRYKDFNDDIKKNLSVDYNILKYRIRHSFKFDFDISYKGFLIGGGSTYNSFMEAIDKIFNIDLLIKDVKKYRDLHHDGNNIYRMRIAYKFKNIKYQLNIDNLFNKEYMIRPGILEAPRSFMFSCVMSNFL